MAGRRYGWINWDAIGDEAEEDAGELNYYYKWRTCDQDEEAMETSDRRRGGRLGQVGGVAAGQARHGHGHTIDVGEGLGNTQLLDLRHRLAHRGDEQQVDEHAEVESEGDVNVEGRENGEVTAVARPRYDANGVMIFDGKSGIWPFTFEEVAQRKSKNKDAGTLVTKVLLAVTKDVSQLYMINFPLPAIWGRRHAAERGMPMYIQHDNAKTHIPVDDLEFFAAAQSVGWDNRLTCQHPNSPDLNILDLGSIEDIVLKVKQAFDEYPAESSNRIFLALQECMLEVLSQLRGNRYKVPHIRKAVLERLGTPPVALQCAASIVRDSIEFLPDT